MSNDLFIRADASLSIGTGHVMRCMALAAQWRARGGKGVFITCCESPTLRKKILATGFQVVSLECSYPSPRDLELTIDNLTQREGRILVLDGYHFDRTYQKTIRDAGIFLVLIDDNADRNGYYADIILNQNIHAPALSYKTDRGTKLLLGTRYVLLRSEFFKWKDWKREIPKTSGRVLVTMGGSDPQDLTSRVLDALGKVKRPNAGGPLEVKIVVGPAGSRRREFGIAVEDGVPPGDVILEVIENPSDISNLMAWADLAVSSGGSTCWELCFMGLPSIILIAAENQVGIAEGLEKAGAVLNLGRHDDISEEKLIIAIEMLVNGREKRRELSRNAAALIDGRGAGRVLDHCLKRRFLDG